MKKFFTVIFLIPVAAFSQKAIDSVFINKYPLKGVMYVYDRADMHLLTEPISITIVTDSDSVFHFSDGKVVGVFSLDETECVTILNFDGNYITYSNLKPVCVKKGQLVSKDSFIGIAARSEPHKDRNELDVIVNNGKDTVSAKECLDYILLANKM